MASNAPAKILAVDADGHIGENSGAIWEYLDQPYKEYRSGFTGPGALTPLDGWDRNLGRRLYRGAAGKAEDWLEALQRGPMEWAAVYPSLGLFYGAIQDPDYQAAFCRAYNTWLARDMCAPSRGKVKGVGILPTHLAEEGINELQRIRQLGLIGAMYGADGRHLLGDKRYHGVYRVAADLNMPIAVHASGSHLHGGGVDLFPKFIQAHTVSHPFGILRQFTSMMFEGVFELFPTVRFGFLETGATWVPWWLDRMDEEYRHRGEVDAPLLRRKPSAYVRQGGNVFFGCEAEERGLPDTMRHIGNDVIMYASDYPHWDGGYPESLHEMASRADLTQEQRYGVLRGAAERFYFGQRSG